MTRVLAVLTLRNEAVFLLEWLAHHRACGITDVIVCSNDCSDGTDAMLDRLEEMGQLTHLRNPAPHREGVHFAALKRVAPHPLRARADWIISIDIDEFLNIHVGDRTVGALLAALPDARVMALTWRMFGNAGIATQGARGVTETFTRAAPARLWWPWRALMVKTLWRNDGGYRRLGIHRPLDPDPARPPPRWFDGAGRELPPSFRAKGLVSASGQDHYALAQINHYALGAMDSFLLKCDRGRANHASTPLDLAYWIDRNFSDDEDITISALRLRAEPLLSKLRADPVLAAIEARAMAWRAERLAALLAQEPWRALLGRLRMTGPSRALSRQEAAALRPPGLAAATPG